MAEPAQTRDRMTVDAFLAWSETWAEGERWELVGGEPVRMASERSRHALVKMDAARELDRAVRAAGLDCTVWPDGMTVRIDDDTAFEPEAIVQCGGTVDPDAVEVEQPMILVEVLSTSTRTVDSGRKLTGYFSLPSVRHYLILDPVKKLMTRHSRRADGGIETAILRDGAATLDPPGLTLEVAALFARV